MQRTEYKDVLAISQSAIKSFRRDSLAKFKRIYIDKFGSEEDEEDEQKFALGNAVDTLAFQQKEFKERFYISAKEMQIPSAKVRPILDKAYKEAVETIKNRQLLNKQGNLPEDLYIPNIYDIAEFRDIIYKYAKEERFGGDKWTRDRILKDVCDEVGTNYFNQLAEASGRVFLSTADNANGVEICDVLKKHPRTKEYFIEQEGENLLFQEEIFGEYALDDGSVIPIKGAMDIIRINHNEKWVQIPDLKTVYNADIFSFNARKFGYLTQASFYNYLLQFFLETYQGGRCKYYTRKQPINIVIDPINKIPYIYVYDWDDVDIERRGCEEKNIKGWEQTLEEIAWHMRTGVWNMPRELYENGFIKLKFYK